MKKIYFLFFLISMNVFSQNILLNFEGKRKGTNESVTLEKVIIENLTANKAVVLEGETSFNIGNTLSTEDFLVNELNLGIVSVFPNPVVSEATIVLNSLGEGLAKIEVYDLSGKSLMSLQKAFSKGQHEIQFKPGKTGIYFVKFSDKDQHYFSKVISVRGNDGKDMLSYVGQHKVNNQLNIQSKKNNNDFFNDDDVLRITVFNGNEKSVIYDSPKESKNYTFFFDDNFFRFEEYLVQSNYPSFVDVMFSVTDSNYKGVDYLENDDFKVLENGSEINKLESFRYVKKLSQVPSKQRTVLMLDKSLSVQENLPTIKEAAIKLIEKIADEQEVAIYSFSENAELLIDFTNDKELLRMAIDEIRVDFPTTNLYGSVIEGLHKINNRYSLDGIEEGYLVVLTDGDDTQASSTLDQVVNARGTKRVFMIGLGEGLNEDNLNEIAYPGNYIKATDANELDEKFDEIRFDMLRFANSFYWLNYMSPKRDSQNTLTVEAINNTNTGEDRNITNTFDSNNFESVTSGVYANVSVGEPYGISTIDLLVEDENTVASIDLKAYTYWAKEVPEYVWTIDNQESFELIINEDDDTKAVLKTKSDNYDTGTLLLEDTANDYSYEIAVNLLTVKPSLEVNVSDIEARKAVLKGVITYQGSSSVIKKGVLLFEGDSNAAFADIDLSDQDGLEFEINHQNFAPGIEYRIQAYAENNQGIGYSGKIAFTTDTDIPSIRTSPDVRNIAATTANTINFVTDHGGLDLIEVGVCWSENANPTIENFKKIGDVNNTYNFDLKIEDLEPSKTYYVRTYAINSLGINYSPQSMFTTTDGEVTNIFIGRSGGTAIAADLNANFTTSEKVVETGFVWSVSSGATLDNNKKQVVAEKSGNFYSLRDEITGLVPSTLYYVRAYVKNDQGVFYSREINFTTLNGVVVFSNIGRLRKDAISAEYRGTVSRPDGLDLEEFGFVWSLDDNPTVHDNLIVSEKPFGNDDFEFLNLVPNTIYYCRMYAKTNYDIQYSNTLSFSTDMIQPTFRNIVLENISPYSVNFLGGVTRINGPEVLEKGFCISSETASPTINDIVLNGGEGLGEMNLELDNLIPSRAYFYRYYVKTEFGYHYQESAKNFVTPSGIYNGNLTFRTQSDIDAYVNIYEHIKGNLIISSDIDSVDPITDITNLDFIKTVEGSLSIHRLDSDSLHGLHNLTSVGKIWIQHNAKILSLNDFESLKEIGDTVFIGSNSELVNAEFPLEIKVDNNEMVSFSVQLCPKLNKIPVFKGVTKLNSLRIESADNLKNMDVFPDLKIIGSLRLQRNKKLEKIIFNNLEQITGSEFLISVNDVLSIVSFPKLIDFATVNSNVRRIFYIVDNPELVDLNGFSNLTAEGFSSGIYNISISKNTKLVNFCGILNFISGITWDGDNTNDTVFHLFQNSFNPSFDDLKTGICSE